MRYSLDSDFTVNSVIYLSKNRGLLLFILKSVQSSSYSEVYL